VRELSSSLDILRWCVLLYALVRILCSRHTSLLGQADPLSNVLWSVLDLSYPFCGFSRLFSIAQSFVFVLSRSAYTGSSVVTFEGISIMSFTIPFTCFLSAGIGRCLCTYSHGSVRGVSHPALKCTVTDWSLASRPSSGPNHCSVILNNSQVRPCLTHIIRFFCLGIPFLALCGRNCCPA